MLLPSIPLPPQAYLCQARRVVSARHRSRHLVHLPPLRLHSLSRYPRALLQLAHRIIVRLILRAQRSVLAPGEEECLLGLLPRGVRLVEDFARLGFEL
ncbi:hypothetical protein HGRIS_004522 [Hohenbuehelia grisea]|uniref:Uncharacterized protein n=1 Tax=Hohenbuehelia grisea TaxID=104357 RepID=A0ABR3JCJ5_9AGAR